MVTLVVNEEEHELDIDPDTPLLWALRDHLGLEGTKYGCGEGLCGACTVHIDGQVLRSCSITVSEVEGQPLTTIEGLSGEDEVHPVQQAWIEMDVPQCGYCQSGQMMAAASLIAQEPDPSDQDIDSGMSGNICRCGTYGRIRKAIRRASEIKEEQ